MKRIALLIAVLFQNMMLLAQGWLLQEVYDDAQDSEPITYKTLFYCGVFFFIIFICNKSIKYLRKQTVDKYKSLLIHCASIYGIFAVLLLLTVSVVNASKKYKLEEEQRNIYQSIIDKADYYIDLSLNLSNIIETKRLWNTEFGKSINELDIFSMQYGMNKEGRIYNGVYHVYQVISSPGIEVLMARTAKDHQSVMIKHPYMIHYRIKPYQIRYFTQKSNPSNDIRIAMEDLVRSLVHNNKCVIMHGWGNELRNEIDNKYFMMETQAGASQYWHDNKKQCLYESDNDYQSCYEYKTVNYGNFEIMFSADYTSYIKYGPKYVIQSLNDNNYNTVIDTEFSKDTFKYVYLIALIGVIISIVFFLSKPKISNEKDSSDNQSK